MYACSSSNNGRIDLASPDLAITVGPDLTIFILYVVIYNKTIFFYKNRSRNKKHFDFLHSRLREVTYTRLFHTVVHERYKE